MFSLTKITALLASMATVATASGCVNATSYLDVYLWDSFGDGWQDAWWVMEDPGSVISKDQAVCHEEVVAFSVMPCDHTPSEGYYYMTVQTPDETLPEGWWEVWWRVDVRSADGNDVLAYYLGNYNSTMIWHYDADTDTWTLTHSDNVVTTIECTGCSGGPCKPKPKPSNKDKKDKGPMKGDGKKDSKKGGTEDTADTVTGASTGGSNSTDMKYGPRAVNLEVEMFSEDGNGWSNVNFLGAHWYIADYTLTKLFDDGSLCDGWSGSCKICLGDGSYVFRVTGPPVNETLEEQWYSWLNITEETPNAHWLINDFRFKSWDFCHTRGSWGDQLKFHVKKGKCYPDDLRWVDEICDSLVNSTVTVSGVVALSGIASEVFTSSDAYAVLEVMAAQVNGWDAGLMAVSATSLDVRSLGASKRALNSFTHDVQFTVKFVSEAYGVDGTNFAAVENLVEDMALTIQNSMTSGVFSSQLAGQAQLMHSELLEEVTAAELVSLEVTSIVYTNSHLVYYYQNEEAADESMSSSAAAAAGLSSGVIALFVIVAAVGFIAFVGIVSHGFNGYSKLPLESQHVDSSSAADPERNPFVSRSIPRVEI